MYRASRNELLQELPPQMRVCISNCKSGFTHKLRQCYVLTDLTNGCESPVAAMRLSWPQHLQASRSVEMASDEQRGMAMALMGISLLVLSQDLLDLGLRSQDTCEDAEPQQEQNLFNKA